MRRNIVTLCLLSAAAVHQAVAQTAPALATPKTSPAQASEQEDDDCDQPGTWTASVCWNKRVERLDSELNKAYRKALGRLPERPQPLGDLRQTKEQLRKSQRAWLHYVDENCSLVGGLGGGSTTSITFYSLVCHATELRSRINFLNRIAGETKP